MQEGHHSGDTLTRKLHYRRFNLMKNAATMNFCAVDLEAFSVAL